MNRDEARARLLTDIQEEYDFDHKLPLYMFAWSLAGIGLDRSDERFEGICREAYDDFRAAHPDLVLAWTPWPINTQVATPAGQGTPIDLDLDAEAPQDEPLLILLRPEDMPRIQADDELA